MSTEVNIAIKKDAIKISKIHDEFGVFVLDFDLTSRMVQGHGSPVFAVKHEGDDLFKGCIFYDQGFAADACKTFFIEMFNYWVELETKIK